jgi:hypothetical protein
VFHWHIPRRETGRRIGKRIAFAALAAALLAGIVGCDLYQGINLAWNVTGVSRLPNDFYRVSYSVQNPGKYDLHGVNLQIGLDIYGNGSFFVAGWTPDFTINQNQVLFGTIDIYSSIAPVGGASVLSVDMDSPSGGKTVLYKKG